MNTLRVSIIEAGKGSEIIVTVIVTNNNLYLELLRRGQAPSIVINNKYEKLIIGLGYSINLIN